MGGEHLDATQDAAAHALARVRVRDGALDDRELAAAEMLAASASKSPARDPKIR